MQINPKGKKKSKHRVDRGGSCDFVPVCCRAANRHSYSSEFVSNYLGFRVVLSSVA